VGMGDGLFMSLKQLFADISEQHNSNKNRWPANITFVLGKNGLNKGVLLLLKPLLARREYKKAIIQIRVKFCYPKPNHARFLPYICVRYSLIILSFDARRFELLRASLNKP
jgi:hypothetical protein